MKNEDTYKKEIFNLSKENLIRENDNPNILVLLEKIFLNEKNTITKESLLKDLLKDE